MMEDFRYFFSNSLFLWTLSIDFNAFDLHDCLVSFLPFAILNEILILIKKKGEI